MLLPALSKAKKPQVTSCPQQSAAYARVVALRGDHDERLVVNDPNVGPGAQSWIAATNDNNPDSTNKTLIARSALSL
jgi:hypothetical protein